jgi:hypothetical protein
MPTLDRSTSWSRTSQASAKPRQCNLLLSKSQVRPLLEGSTADLLRSSQKMETPDVVSCILMLLGLGMLTTAVLGFFGTQAVLGTGSYSFFELLRGLCF